MTWPLPEGTQLGALHLTETLVDYEGPRLFSCRNSTGQRFVGLWVEETEHWDHFLYVPVTRNRLDTVRSGLMPLADAFRRPEGEGIYEVKVPLSGDVSEAEVVRWRPERLPERWFPVSDARLDLPTNTQARFDPEAVRAASMAEDRPRAAVRLMPDRLMRTEYPLRDLGVLMQAVQEAVDAFGQELEGKPTARGRIPNEILEETEFAFTGQAAASFVFTMAAKGQGTLFDQSLGARALERLVQLLSASASESHLRHELSGLGVRAVSKLRDLLDEVARGDIGLGVYLAHAGDLLSAELTDSDVTRMLEVVRSTEEVPSTTEAIMGRLIGVNVRTKVYEILELDSNEKYAGRIAEQAMSQVEGATIQHVYRATILVEHETSAVTGEMKQKRSLIALEPR